jgi:hypothetical protein
VFTRHAVVPPASTSSAALGVLHLDAISILLMRHYSRSYCSRFSISRISRCQSSASHKETPAQKLRRKRVILTLKQKMEIL